MVTHSRETGPEDRPRGALSRRLGPVADHPARRLRDAMEPIAMHVTGSPAVRRALSGRGLDRFTGYVWGRAATLGDPTLGEVVAAFGVFEPATLGAAYLAGRAACPRSTLLQLRQRETERSLRTTLGDAADVEGVVTALRHALSSAPSDDRPLFAGLAALPWPDDPLGQLWRACDLLREHRGGTHWQVCVRYGLDGIESNILTELWLGIDLGTYTRTRGWDDAALATAAGRLEQRGLLARALLTDRGRALRTAVEAETNDGEGPIVRALGPQLEPVVRSLAEWSRRCIATGTFTADEAKRAAG